MKTLEMIVPCFNESDVLQMFYNEVTPIMQSLDGYDYRFIFVNDGSRDDTLKIIKALAEQADGGIDALAVPPQPVELVRVGQ